jgi:hypothetical protein
LALQALGIKVWIDRGNVNIEGVIPLETGDIVSSTSSYTEK